MSDHNSPEGGPEQEKHPEDIMMQPEDQEADYRPLPAKTQILTPTPVKPPSPRRDNQRIILLVMVVFALVIMLIALVVANLQDDLRSRLEQAETSRLTQVASAAVGNEDIQKTVAAIESQLATLTAELSQQKSTDEAQMRAMESLRATQDQLSAIMTALVPTATPTATIPPPEPTLEKGECFGTLNSDSVSVLPRPGASHEEVIEQLFLGERVIVMQRIDYQMEPRNNRVFYYKIRTIFNDSGYVLVNRIDLDDDCDHFGPRDR